METVGVYLKKERESKNISLREVARLTKISEIYLHCIEKDDYDKLPQGPYIKGYISSYSRLIGGNVDEALKLYDSLNPQKKQTADFQPEFPKEKRWRSSIGASIASVVGSLNRNKNNNKNHRLANRAASRFDGSTAPSTDSHQLLPGADKSPTASPLTPLKEVPPAVKPAPMWFARKVESLSAGLLKIKAMIPSSTAVASTLRDSGKWLKKVGVSGMRKTTLLYEASVPFFRKATSAVKTKQWITHRRVFLYASGAGLLGVCILVLAGFGFYYLFVFDMPAPVAAEPETKIVKQTPPTADMGAIETHASTAPPRSGAQPPSSVSDPGVESMATAPVPHIKKPAAMRSLSPAEHAEPILKADNQKSLPTSPPKEAATSQQPAAPPSSPVNLSVLKASICSEIKDRMPSGVESIFPSSTQRIYVWNQIQAHQYPTQIRHIYYHKNQKISDVALNVRSPFWRTWSYKSIASDRYRGRWYVDIATLDGKVLRRLYFEVQ
jgi:cytoskeletal protein RodZ